MITIITGATHTGKTALAQRLLVKTQSPYLSQDLLKMGLIRSNMIDVDAQDNEKLTEIIWPITKEIIKTAIENEQRLIVEGIYVPELWITGFDDSELQHIRFTCLVMSEEYIKNNFKSIKNHAEVVQKRLSNDIDVDTLIEENKKFLDMCEDNLYPYQYIEGDYFIDIDTLII